MKALLVLACFAVAASALTVTSQNVGTVFKFQAWMEQFDKSYATAAEYDHAFHNFVASLARIAKRDTHGGKTQWGLTKFSDLSPAEFKKFYLTAKPQKHQGPINLAPKIKHARAPPTRFDWRDKNAVTPVKDQAQCGSCWAFSTTENFESMWFLAGNKLPTLGPQQLVDCDPQSQGCGGGWTYWAFQYLMTAGGQEAEADYPYMARNQPCAFKASAITAYLANYTFAIPACEQGPCQNQNEDDLQQQLMDHGPMSVCVNAASWSDYTGGVVQGSSCSGDAGGIDHCVQLVGFNTDDQGNKYWIVRNSWNTGWGDQGYIYLQFGQNTCAVADVVTYANVGKAPKHHHH